MAQRLKHLPAMRETWVQSLGWEDPLEKDVTTHSSILAWRIPWIEASQVALVVKNPPANAGDAGSIPESGRSPGEGNSNALQYSCLENPTDRGTWQATIHRVTKNQT